jgi:transposase InsO family protein
MKVVHPEESGQAVGCDTRSDDRRIARMNIHKNARLTPQGRYLLAQRVDELGWRMAEAATAAGISQRQGYRWLARYRTGGAAALGDRSSAPGSCKHRIAAERITEITALRRQRMSGPAIARRLGMPVSTVGALLRRLGLGKLAAVETKPPIVRYERQRPGELIHLDSKKLGRIAAIGHRFTGRAAGSVNRHHGIGWEALHVCIDDATRLAYSEILPDERKETAVGFLERALGWLARQGITVERVMTDNGSAYLSKAFRAAIADAGLKHKRTWPYTPRTNGKAERFIQTSLREWAYARAYATSQERGTALAPWLDHYNTERPHAALAHNPPAARLRQSQLLCSTERTVASSRPASDQDCSGGPGQGSPKATGVSPRAASLRRTEAAVTLAHGGILA